MTLQDEVIRLECVNKHDVADYLAELYDSCRFSVLGLKEAKDLFLKHALMSWVVYDKTSGLKLGMIYLSLIDDMVFLDAYRSYTIPFKDVRKFSLRAGKLVCDYAKRFDNTLYTAHDVSNRAATVAVKKLGFTTHNTIITPYGEFIILKKELNHGC